MKIRIYFLLILLFIISVRCKTSDNGKNDLSLWYKAPATDWMTEALPVGNGYMGAMFYGGVGQEQIQFTEGSLWSGGPGASSDYNFGNRKDAWKYLPEVRELLNKGKFTEADRLAKKQLTGVEDNFGAQQTMGDLFIRIDKTGEPSKYKREIDLNTGEGKVSYEMNGDHFERTYFGDYPQKILVYHFKNSAKTGYKIQFKTPHNKLKETFNNNVYSFVGQVADNKMEFETCLKIESDGKVSFENGEIIISGAKNLTIYHLASTDYLPEYPTYKGNDYLTENKNILANINGKSYNKIRKEHLKDYRNLYDRVELNLGENTRDSIPTNRRLIEFAEGIDDPGLEQIYFQYSRYLMISASRPGTLPMNLQGKWNNSTNPPWTCDYHTNINLEMLYWPAEVTNLNECHLPLFDYMQTLVEPGRVSAKDFFNARGWIVNTMNNEFGYTATGWDFPWGFFPGGAAWLCQHAWEHFAFTRDTTFLKETAYPLMKEAALFWMDYLTEDENGFLVSSPSYSPEHGGISKGASMDHQIAWDVLNNCIQACEILKTDDDFKTQATSVRDRILPPTIGKWGQLQEWKEDVDDPNDHHRHASHLFALYPGKQITMETTPELAEAARVSLNARGDDGTGWSLAWKINFWARLKDGDRAYKLLKNLLRPTGAKGTNYSDGGGTYPNLFCAHPPFQLDGNMGGCAGIAEMLLQSHADKIEFLPALPAEWKNGEVKGLKARGGFEVNMKWKEGKLVQAEIKGTPGLRGQYKYRDQSDKFEIPASGIFKLEFI